MQSLVPGVFLLPCIWKKLPVAGSVSIVSKDIRNPLSLLAHERSRFATCQWELLTPTDISIPLTHRLVLYALEAGECLFCVHTPLHYYSIAPLVSTQKISFTLFLFRIIILSHIFYSQIFC